MTMTYVLFPILLIIFTAVPALPETVTHSSQDITADSIGNFYIAGHSEEYGFLVIKYNDIGVKQYTLTFPGSRPHDTALAVKVDNIGNIYAIGNKRDSLLTIKYNKSGVRQWHQTCLPQNLTLLGAADITVDSTGNVYSLATVYGKNKYTGILLVKYNGNGVMQWHNLYENSDSSRNTAAVIGLDTQANIYVGGMGIRSEQTDYDYLVLKYNPNGVLQWDIFYDGENGTDNLSDMQVNEKGDVCVTGQSLSLDTNWDFCTVFFNSAGTIQWTKRFNSVFNSSDRACALTRDDKSNYYIAGSSKSDTTAEDFVLVKYNASGVEQWRARWDGRHSLDDTAVDVALDSSGNAVIVGATEHISAGLGFATVKYNPSGVRQWTAFYHHYGISNERPQAMVMDRNGSVCITGTSGNTIGGTDIATAKYSASGVQLWVSRYGHDPAKVETDSPSAPQSFQVFPHYPNPFNAETVIPFYSPQAGEIQLDVYNLRGQKILSKQFFTDAGYSNMHLDAYGWESGVYFYRFKLLDINVCTGKLIIIK